MYTIKVGNSLFGFSCESLIFWQKERITLLLSLKEWNALFALFKRAIRSCGLFLQGWFTFFFFKAKPKMWYKFLSQVFSFQFKKSESIFHNERRVKGRKSEEQKSKFPTLYIIYKSCATVPLKTGYSSPYLTSPLRGSNPSLQARLQTLP